MNGAFRRGLFVVVLVGVVVTLTGCETSGGVGPAAANFPFWFPDNDWVDEEDDEHVFALSSLTGTGTETGTFDGDETLPDGTNTPLTGFWSMGTVQFTVQSTPLRTWRGPLVGDDPGRLELTSGANRLVLIRQAE